MRLLKQDKPLSKSDRSRDGEVVYSTEFPSNDAVLLLGIRAEHAGAYRAFYRRYGEYVYTILLRTIGCDDELEDLVHEVFVRVFRGVGALKDIERLRSWIAAVAVNTARDALKARRRRRWMSLFSPAELPEKPPAFACDAAEEAVETVYALLDELSVESRITFTLRYMQDMSLEDLASASGVSLATAKRRLARAKKQFIALATVHPALKEWLR